MSNAVIATAASSSRAAQPTSAAARPDRRSRRTAQKGGGGDGRAYIGAMTSPSDPRTRRKYSSGLITFLKAEPVGSEGRFSVWFGMIREGNLQQHAKCCAFAVSVPLESGKVRVGCKG